MRRPSERQLVGLEIGDDAIRMAVAVGDGARRTVRAHQSPLARGAVEGGRVRSPGAVSDAIRSALGALGVRARAACLVLDGRRTLCRVEPEAEGQEPATRRTSAERMRRYLAFGGQPVLVAHTRYRPRSLDGGQAWLLTAATQHEMLASQVAAARRGGLTIVRAVPGIAAVAWALLAREDTLEPVFLLAAHADGVEIGVLRDDGLIFCQRCDQRPDADAEPLATALEQLADYHFRHARGRAAIQALRCCGRGAGLPTLPDTLDGEAVDAAWLDPLDLPGVDRLEAAGLDDPQERAAMTLAVAAALSHGDPLRQADPLDLLPPPPTRKRLGLLAPWLVVPAVLTLGLTAGLATATHLMRRRAAQLVDAVSRPTPEMAECSRLLHRESELRERGDDAAQLLGQVPRHSTRAFLAELPRRLADGVWLDRIQLGDNGACVLNGVALTEDAAFDFRRALSQSPYVQTARLGSTGAETSGRALVTRFRLDIMLAEEPAPPRPAGKPAPPQAARTAP